MFRLFDGNLRTRCMVEYVFKCARVNVCVSNTERVTDTKQSFIRLKTLLHSSYRGYLARRNDSTG